MAVPIPVDSKALRDHRRPLDDLEMAVVRRVLDCGDSLEHPDICALRYVLGFAKLTHVRTDDGVDKEVIGALRTHAWWVRDRLEARLSEEGRGLVPALEVLPEVVEATRQKQDELLTLGLSAAAIQREVCERKLVLVLGGGGGAGFGYAGVFDQLARAELQPELICGTSIGALLGLFRARRRRHDGRALIEVSKSLSWKGVFTVHSEPSRYGLPATLRLHLRRALSDFLLDDEGQPLRFQTLPIPMHMVVTGLKMEALKHELEYYEHYLDAAVKPGLVFRVNRVFKMRNVASVLKEIMQEQEALEEIVFGLDPLTQEADCLDAAGFSSGIPGLIHYDIHREDAHMHHLLERLYAEYGITRLAEGGIVNNLPAKVAWKSAMEGRLGGHRNIFVLALDCFAPRPRSAVFYPIQQLVRGNVVKNLPYCHHYESLGRTLSPLNLVPDPEQIQQANEWATRGLAPKMPLIKAMLTPFPPLGPA